MYALINTTDSYYFDEFKEDNTLVPFTNKNRNIVEACVRYDSRYKSDIKEMVKDLEHNYNLDNVKAIVKKINDVNHTRSSKEAINELANRIFNKFNAIEELKVDLNTHTATENIFKMLAEKTINRYDTSLATKIIFHLSQGLNCDAHNMYPKYDSKVAQNLYRYLKAYDISNNYNNKSFDMRNKTIDEIVETYRDYCHMIILLLTKVSEIKYLKDITLEQLDHIMWYTNK